jgi:hypothetical protein
MAVELDITFFKTRNFPAIFASVSRISGVEVAFRIERINF